MTLLAQYTTQPDGTYDLALLDIETLDLHHVIAHAEAVQHDLTHIDLARAYAAEHGHTIGAIDSAALFKNFTPFPHNHHAKQHVSRIRPHHGQNGLQHSDGPSA